MKRKISERHIARYILAGIALTLAALATVIISGQAGGNKGTQPNIPKVATRVPAPRLPTIQAPGGLLTAPVPEGATGSGTTNGPVAVKEPPASAAPTAPTTHDTPPLVEQAGGTELTDQGRAWIYEYLLTLEKARQRAAMIARIDGYLANRGSPMQGLGWAFFDSAARYGIDPRLSVAIAEGESSCGKCCFASHNAWGMLAYRSGFGSWEEGINANLDWLRRYFGSPQTAYDCPGYCVPDYPWMDNVDRVRRSI